MISLDFETCADGNEKEHIRLCPRYREAVTLTASPRLTLIKTLNLTGET